MVELKKGSQKRCRGRSHFESTQGQTRTIIFTIMPAQSKRSVRRWQDWPLAIRKKIPLLPPQELKKLVLEGKLTPKKLGTWCTGTGGVEKGGDKMFGPALQCKCAADTWGPARQFQELNAPSEHCFKNNKGYLHPHVQEYACAKPGDDHGPHCVPCKLDIMVGGFPCTPFSPARENRFKDDPWAHPDAQVFLDILQFLEQDDPEGLPDGVILENVFGMMKSSPKHRADAMAPYEVVRAKLDALTHFAWSHIVLNGSFWTPGEKKRLYFALVQRRKGGQAAVDRIIKSTEGVHCGKEIQPGSIQFDMV